MPELDIAWAAGFVDGEGCLMAYPRKNRPSYRLKAEVTNTDIRPLLKLRDMFGGWVYSSHKPTKNWNAGFRWTIEGKKAAQAIKLMERYLIVKKEQAILFLEFAGYIGQGDRHDERKTEIVCLLKEAKRHPVTEVN